MAGRQPTSNFRGSAPRHGRRGLTHVGGFVRQGLGKAPTRRGLSEMRLLTDWSEVAGPEVASICTPQRISHAGRQMGGTLTVQVHPGRGPEVDMLAPQIIERVNACFGYRAVARLKASQTAAAGFAETATSFDVSGAPVHDRQPSAEQRQDVSDLVSGLPDDGLRDTFEKLGLAIAMRPKKGANR